MLRTAYFRVSNVYIFYKRPKGELKMKKIKQKRTEKLSSYITRDLSEEINEYAEKNGELSRSKAIEILILKGLQK